MVVKSNLTEKFNYNKNGMTIKVSNYLRTGVKFGETKKMVKDQITVFPNKDSSIVKVMRSQVNIPPIKIHSPMRMMKNNPDKVHFKRSKVEKNKNKVSNYKWGLVNNYKDVRMISSQHLQLQVLEHSSL